MATGFSKDFVDVGVENPGRRVGATSGLGYETVELGIPTGFGVTVN